MPNEDWMFGLREAVRNLPADETAFRFYYGLRHGTMRVGLYAPRGEDQQSTHSQDELYIVIRGTGNFVKDGVRKAFEPQDVIFAEAGSTHHFEDFSDDFATWVIFWGVQGGER